MVQPTNEGPYKSTSGINKPKVGPFNKEEPAPEPEVFKAENTGDEKAYRNEPNATEPPRKLDLEEQKKEPATRPGLFSNKPGYTPYFRNTASPNWSRNITKPENPEIASFDIIEVQISAGGPQGLLLDQDYDPYL